MSKWAKFWLGVKIALGFAVSAQEHGLIKIKELPEVAAIVQAVDGVVGQPKQ